LHDAFVIVEAVIGRCDTPADGTARVIDQDIDGTHFGANLFEHGITGFHLGEVSGKGLNLATLLFDFAHSISQLVLIAGYNSNLRTRLAHHHGSGVASNPTTSRHNRQGAEP